MKKFLFSAYRYLLWPIFRSECRFYPSCSKYSEEAIKTNGWVLGCAQTVIRLAKCHPFHPGGVDPVSK